MRIFRFASQSFAIFLLLASLLFAHYYGKYDAIMLFATMLLPITYAILALSKQGPFFYAYIAYLFSLTDDAPVYLDSVFTWPEVTGGSQHYVLEVVFHLFSPETPSVRAGS